MLSATYQNCSRSSKTYKRGSNRWWGISLPNTQSFRWSGISAGWITRGVLQLHQSWDTLLVWGIVICRIYSWTTQVAKWSILIWVLLSIRYVYWVTLHIYCAENGYLKGTRLPIPETVPFRLTADIVDGMGMAGTDGVFRRCAEETLRLLREESNIIMTVLEVFKTDPLHSWYVRAYHHTEPKAHHPS